MQLFAVACLYLGGKVEDSPKSVRDVLMASCKHRYKEAAHRLQHDRVRRRSAALAWAGCLFRLQWLLSSWP